MLPDRVGRDRQVAGRRVAEVMQPADQPVADSDHRSARVTADRRRVVDELAEARALEPFAEARSFSSVGRSKTACTAAGIPAIGLG